MLELVATRTLMSLLVLEKIPLDGSISLKELSEATGAQESLIGTSFLTTFSMSYASSDNPESVFYAWLWVQAFLVRQAI
jgi:hypothetical protein